MIAARSHRIAQRLYATMTSTTPCIEIVTFRLVKEAKKEDFVAAADETKKAIADFGGCNGRYLSADASGNGLWTDMVIWKDQETALKAAQVIPRHPSFAKFGSMIDPASVAMRHSNVTNWM